ncbi:MAG: glycosyltransferase [Desulfobacula sp.]|nr:glycosyltransferase [Desulfobacula sp.]
MRGKILKHLLKNCPKGNLNFFEKTLTKISCIFIFYQRHDLMTNILHCLNNQIFNQNEFEVILVEDRGGSERGRTFADKFQSLNIRYFAPEINWGKMGFMRNFGLSKARGKIVLFLDDDTVILNNHFLHTLYNTFKDDHTLDAVQPRGSASYALINDRYSYHDPYFFTNRCMAYQKSCLEQLHGFDSNFTGQEDVELAIRFIAKNFKVIQSKYLNYYHPPLIFNDSSKGYAVGASFARSKYSGFIKILLLANGARWLPLGILPGLKNKFMARFAFGFLTGFIQEIFGKHKKIDYL